MPENPWATILCVVDVVTQTLLERALPERELRARVRYQAGPLLHQEAWLEPAITSIVDWLLA